MWLAGSREPQVYLGLGSAGVMAPAKAVAPAIEWLACTSAIDGWSQAAALLNANAGSRSVRLWLSGALCRPFILEPVAGLRTKGDAYRIACEMAPERTGLAGPCEVWFARWTPDEAVLCVAIDVGLRNEIEAIARVANLKLRGLGPWWDKALADLLSGDLRQTRLLAVDDTDALTMLSGEQDAFTATMSVVPKPDAAQAASIVARMALTQAMGQNDAVFARMAEVQGALRFDVQFEAIR